MATRAQTVVQNNPKASAAGAAGGGSIVLVWIAGQLGLDMSPEVASAFTTLVAAIAARFVPPPSGEGS